MDLFDYFIRYWPWFGLVGLSMRFSTHSGLCYFYGHCVLWFYCHFLLESSVAILLWSWCNGHWQLYSCGSRAVAYSWLMFGPFRLAWCELVLIYVLFWLLYLSCVLLGFPWLPLCFIFLIGYVLWSLVFLLDFIHWLIPFGDLLASWTSIVADEFYVRLMPQPPCDVIFDLSLRYIDIGIDLIISCDIWFDILDWHYWLIPLVPLIPLCSHFLFFDLIAFLFADSLGLLYSLIYYCFNFLFDYSRLLLCIIYHPLSAFISSWFTFRSLWLLHFIYLDFIFFLLRCYCLLFSTVA